MARQVALSVGLCNKQSTQAGEASPIARMQTLEGPEATLQVTTVVRHQSTVAGNFVSDERANSQGKTTEEVEFDEFETFKSFRVMRKLQSEKRLQKEWDRVSVHTDQTEDYNKEENESYPHGKRSSKNEKDVDRLPDAENAYRKQDKLPEVIEAKQYNQAFKSLNFRSPFTNDINETPIPKGLKWTRVPPYDDTGDPDNHVCNTPKLKTKNFIVN
ncbi:unnamed protein product [Lactuca saligna]|uniref:Uncharacterized protein n=1 Tax=Lactuca saligna TaxID=75948 RepID=A0AA35YF93_LACSI|nr:unnamed protein product [Lactuca saligna]